jgi:hypothetical protein
MLFKFGTPNIVSVIFSGIKEDEKSYKTKLTN